MFVLFSCHLVLGDIDEALYNFKKCSDSGVVCLDRRLAIDASDGIQNAEVTFTIH